MADCDVRQLQWRNKSISTTRQSLDVARGLGSIVESSPYLADTKIKAVLKIDKSLRAPNLFPQFFAGDQVAAARCQDGQDFSGLRPQLDGHSGFSQLSRDRIELKNSETKH